MSGTIETSSSFFSNYQTLRSDGNVLVVADVQNSGTSGSGGTVTLTGDVTGSGNGTVATTLASVGTPGTYAKVTTDAKGRVTGGANLASSDVTSALGFTPLSANQAVTLSGDVTGSGSTAITATLASVGTAGTYTKVTTDAKGRVTAGSALASSDVTSALGYTPLQSNQTVTLSGDASGSGSTAITVTLGSVGTAGTYTKVTTDSKGRVTAGSAIASSDVTSALGFTPLSANQTITLSGDATGSGSTAITVTLGSVGTAGTYTKVTTDAKGRVTAGTTLATSDLPAASSILDTIGGTQGDILYRSATGWAVLTPGTSGQVLQTGGAGANPSWATVAAGGGGSGTVTSVGTGTGLTGGPITTSGTISLASVSNNTVLGNVSGSSAAPTALSKAQLTTLVNAFTSTLSGAVPASGGGTTNFLRADGSWAAPPGGGGGGSTVVRGAIAGFLLSNDATSPNTVLDIGAGQCADSTAANWITTTGTFYASTGGAWASGAGTSAAPVGKMGTGLTVAANTWYHVFAILNGGSADVYFDTSVTAANSPAGTTAYRRIGSFKTDGSGNVLPYKQVLMATGRVFLWPVATQDYNAGISYTSGTLVTMNVPPGVKVRPLGRAMGNGSVNTLITSPDEESDVATGNSTTAPGNDLGYFGSVADQIVGQHITNTAAQLRFRTSGNVTMGLFTRGWIDACGAGQ